jgi:hypothetical protein
MEVRVGSVVVNHLWWMIHIAQALLLSVLK